MYISSILIIVIIVQISSSSIITLKPQPVMCFSKEIIEKKLINIISKNSKLVLEEFDDNYDYIDLDERTELTCDNKTLSLIQLNIRGLFSKTSALNLLLTEHLGDVKPDLVLLCETCLKPKQYCKDRHSELQTIWQCKK